jgi:chromosome segregation ATPase
VFVTDHPARRGDIVRTAVLLALLVPALALAQSAPSREQEQIRRLRQQLQQLQQELATARQAEAAARIDATRRIGEAEAAARRAQRGVTGTRGRITELEAELAALRERGTATEAQLLQRTGERDEARQALAQARDELGRRAQRLAEGERGAAELLARHRAQNAALELCSRHNQSLKAVSLELLDRWQRHDWRDVVAAKEPFVQGRRVQIENLVQGYEDRIDAAQLPARP